MLNSGIAGLGRFVDVEWYYFSAERSYSRESSYFISTRRKRAVKRNRDKTFSGVVRQTIRQCQSTFLNRNRTKVTSKDAKGDTSTEKFYNQPG